jgi:N-acetylglucosamine-6-phosphate deacetylase
MIFSGILYVMNIFDIHTHGIAGYDTRTNNADDILKIAEVHGSYGVSKIILTIYPYTIKTMRENMEAVKKAMEEQSEAGIKNKSAEIIGMHVEGPFLNPLKSGALPGSSFRKPDEYNLKKLIEGYDDVIKIITLAPEIEGALRLIKKISDMGIIVSMGHSDASYAEAEAGFHAGARGITHLFNAMRGYHHREPGISGFGLMNRDIYIEVIADPFHLHPKTIDLILKMKNHDRIIIVSDTVRETNPGNREKEKTVTDSEGKLLGGCMTVFESADRLIRMGYNENTVMKFITRNAENYLFAK